MSIKTKPQLSKLEDNSLWKEACDLAEYMYGKLHEFPDEERWATESKLRSSASDMMLYTAQALGNTSPGSLEYDWGLVRKYVSGLKTMYRFAGRQKFIELEPAIMVRLDKFIKQIDTEVTSAYKQTEACNQKEMQRWRKKYELWKEMSHED